MNKKNVFITGAAGFIGYHLAHYLCQRGDFVVGYDNFNSYYSTKLKRDRAQNLQKMNIEMIEGDVCDAKFLQKSIERFPITHLVHLAAQAGVRYSLKNPHAYLKSNVEGFLNVLEICRQYPHIPLIYASSSSVYGLNQNSLFSEKDRTDHQASLYGVTKKSNELLAHTYHHLYGISVTGLRYFTVYGPWGRPDMAYTIFTKAIIEGRPIEVFNHGQMERGFTYIDDVVLGTAAAIDLKVSCEVFNLGNHTPVKLLDFIRILENAIGKKAKLELFPMQKGDVFKTCADISHSTKLLGYEPKTTLEIGIPTCVAWYKNYYGLA